MGKLERLERAMSRSLKGLDLARRMRENKAIALWGPIVGETIHARTRALYMSHGSLIVAVATAAWAQQLNLLKPRLLQALAEKLGPELVSDLRFRVQPLDAESPTPPRPAPPPLEEAALQRIERMLTPLPEGDLKRTVNKALEAQARRKVRLLASGWVPCKRCGVPCDPRAPSHPGLGPNLCPVCRLELIPLLE